MRLARESRAKPPHFSGEFGFITMFWVGNSREGVQEVPYTPLFASSRHFFSGGWGVINSENILYPTSWAVSRARNDRRTQSFPKHHHPLTESQHPLSDGHMCGHSACPAWGCFLASGPQPGCVCVIGLSFFGWMWATRCLAKPDGLGVRFGGKTSAW